MNGSESISDVCDYTTEGTFQPDYGDYRRVVWLLKFRNGALSGFSVEKQTLPYGPSWYKSFRSPFGHKQKHMH